jgi:hypothetical protein
LGRVCEGNGPCGEEDGPAQGSVHAGREKKKKRKIKEKGGGPQWARPAWPRGHAWPMQPGDHDPMAQGHLLRFATQGHGRAAEEGQGRPGNLPARARARRRGRGWSVVSRNGRSNVAASSLAPAAPPSPRYPAAALERRRPASLEREGSRVRPLGRPKTERNGGAGVGIDEEGAATFFSGR